MAAPIAERLKPYIGARDAVVRRERKGILANDGSMLAGRQIEEEATRLIV